MGNHDKPNLKRNQIRSCLTLGVGGVLFGLLASMFPSPLAAMDRTSLGGVSIRELLELREVALSELAEMAAPAIVEIIPPAPVKVTPQSLVRKGGIQIRVSPAEANRARAFTFGGIGAGEVVSPPSIITAAPKIRVSQISASEIVSVNGVAETIRVHIEDGKLNVTPSELRISGLNARIAISLGESSKPGSPLIIGKNASFFVRDSDVAEWDTDQKEFRTRGPGKTEIYVVALGLMQIIPISVSQEATAPLLARGDSERPILESPKELTELTEDLRGPKRFQASLGDGSELAAGTDGDQSTTAVDGLAEVKSLSDEQTGNGSEDDHGAKKFFRDVSPMGYLSLVVQVIDERSNISANRLFPVSGVNVRIAGTEFLGKTDAYGRVVIKDVPRNSRFYITADDPYGRIKSSYSEVVTPAKATAEIPIKITVVRQLTFEALTQIAGLSQNAGAASVCGRAVSRVSRAPLVGIKIRTDVPGEGPYYFNSLGLMDPSIETTGRDGRFCIFNIEPGPLMLSFLEGQDLAANLVIPTFSGRHLEESFELGEEAAIVTGIASVSTAEEQLGSDSIAANKLSPLEYAELVPIGDQESLERKDFGVLKGRGIAQSYRGQSLVVSQSSVFEPAIYAFSGEAPRDSAGTTVASLLPRGFIEDMSFFAQIIQDTSHGSVVVEHGIQDALGKEPVNFRLVSDRGEDVGSVWNYADFPVAKAIFFNVPPGNYSLMVESGSKYWISSTTVTVYSEHAAVVSTGKKIRQQAERYAAQVD